MRACKHARWQAARICVRCPRHDQILVARLPRPTSLAARSALSQWAAVNKLNAFQFGARDAPEPRQQIDGPTLLQRLRSQFVPSPSIGVAAACAAALAVPGAAASKPAPAQDGGGIFGAAPAKKPSSQRAKLTPLIRADGGRFDMLKEKTEDELQVTIIRHSLLLPSPSVS